AAHGGQILLSQAAAELAQGRLPTNAGLLPLGPQRLRGLERPEPAFPLLAPVLRERFPVLAPLASPPHNRPAQTPGRIGRTAELVRLGELLLAGGGRLLTLTGPGGVGKTRLALALAADALEAFPDGCWIVECAALTDPADLVF